MLMVTKTNACSILLYTEHTVVFSSILLNTI